jgi:putative ABC transport system permease protein
MAASLLAALISVIKLARMQPASLVKIFADER